MSSSEEISEEENEEKLNKIDEYRNKLLGALKGADGDFSSTYRKRDFREGNSEEEQELDIKFNVGFGEDVGKKLLEDKKEKAELEKESEWQKYQRKRKEKSKDKKEVSKIKKEA